MARKGKRKGGRYSTQVQAESILRFNPERSSLKSALRDAAATRDTTIGAARGAAEGAKSTARSVRPELQGSYRQAQGAVDEILQKLGVHSADNAVGRDAAVTTGRLAERLQMGLNETASRENDAASGYTYAVQAANGRYAGDRAKLRDRLSQLAREQGAFQQARSGELSAEDRQRNFTAKQNAANRRNSRLTAGVDKSGRVIPGGPKDVNGDGQPDSKGKGGADAALTPSGVKVRTPDAHDKFRGAIDSASNAVLDAERRVKADHPGLTGKALRAAVAAAARAGSTDVTVSAPNPKNKDQRVSTKAERGVNPVTNDLALKIALDLEFDKHVSRAYRKLLWDRGYSLKMLGLPGPVGGGAKKPASSKRGGRPAPATSVGQRGNSDRARAASHVTVKTHTRRRPARRK